MSEVRTFHHVSSIQTYFWQSILTWQHSMPKLCSKAFVFTGDFRDMKEDARRRSLMNISIPGPFVLLRLLAHVLFSMTCILIPSHEL
jgi:hypothetical protein